MTTDKMNTSKNNTSNSTKNISDNNNNNSSNKYNNYASTIADHTTTHNEPCIVYKFQSRPPYEGFVLILVIMVIITLLIWYLYR